MVVLVLFLSVLNNKPLALPTVIWPATVKLVAVKFVLDKFVAVVTPVICKLPGISTWPFAPTVNILVPLLTNCKLPVVFVTRSSGLSKIFHQLPPYQLIPSLAPGSAKKSVLTPSILVLFMARPRPPVLVVTDMPRMVAILLTESVAALTALEAVSEPTE